MEDHHVQYALPDQCKPTRKVRNILRSNNELDEKYVAGVPLGSTRCNLATMIGNQDIATMRIAVCTDCTFPGGIHWRVAHVTTVVVLFPILGDSHADSEQSIER